MSFVSPALFIVFFFTPLVFPRCNCCCYWRRMFFFRYRFVSCFHLTGLYLFHFALISWICLYICVCWSFCLAPKSWMMYVALVHPPIVPHNPKNLFDFLLFFPFWHWANRTNFMKTLLKSSRTCIETVWAWSSQQSFHKMKMNSPKRITSDIVNEMRIAEHWEEEKKMMFGKMDLDTFYFLRCSSCRSEQREKKMSWNWIFDSQIHTANNRSE